MNQAPSLFLDPSELSLTNSSPMVMLQNMRLWLYSRNATKQCRRTRREKMVETTLTILVQDSVFLIVILLARKTLLKHSRPKHVMLLWYVVVVRLLIPLPFPSLFSLFSSQSNTTPFVPHESPICGLFASGTSCLGSFDKHLLLAVWGMGTAACLANEIIACHHWAKNHPTLGVVDDPDILEWVAMVPHHPKHSLVARIKLIYKSLPPEMTRVHQASFPQSLNEPPIRPNIRLLWADKLQTPIACGYMFPTIMFPPNVSRLSKSQKRHIVEHELVHIRRQDPLFKLLVTLACCFFWFNPLIWIMRTLMNRDIELVCDEQVIRYESSQERRSYATLLLTFAHPKRQNDCKTFQSAFSSGTASFLAERIQSMKRVGAQSNVSSFFSCLASLLVAFTLSTSGVVHITNPWLIQTNVGSIVLPDYWQGKVEISRVGTAHETESTVIYPIGQPEQPLVELERVSDWSTVNYQVNNISLVAKASYAGFTYLLWGFDYSDSVSELPKWDSSIPLVNAWQLSTGGNPDMDSLEFLQQEVVPTFCAA